MLFDKVGKRRGAFVLEIYEGFAKIVCQLNEYIRFLRFQKSIYMIASRVSHYSAHLIRIEIKHVAVAADIYSVKLRLCKMFHKFYVVFLIILNDLPF